MAPRYTLRQLEYLVAVGEEGSVARAARRLAVSAPSVSVALSDLEAELGLALFVRRHARGLVPTPGGRRVVAAARDVLRRAEAIQALAADVAEGLAGPLAVGCLQSFAPMVLPELRARFEAEHPRVRVRQEEGDHEGLVEALRSGDLDLVLTYDLPRPPGVRFEPLAPVEPYVMLAPGHPLAGLPALTPRDLRPHPMVLLDLPGSAAYFLGAFDAVGGPPMIAARTRDLTLARAMVANGLGFGLVNVRPLSDLAADGKRLAYRPLVGGPRTLSLGLARLDGPTPTRVAEAFAAHCRALIRPDAIPGLRAG